MIYAPGDSNPPDAVMLVHMFNQHRLYYFFRAPHFPVMHDGLYYDIIVLLSVYALRGQTSAWFLHLWISHSKCAGKGILLSCWASTKWLLCLVRLHNSS